MPPAVEFDLECASTLLDTACIRMESACGLVEKACGALEHATPEAFEESATLLEAAVEALAAIQASHAGRTGTTKIEIEDALRIQAAARRARFLLDSAARFYAGWQVVLASMTGGYNAAGSPAAVPTASRLQLSA